jgi:hypothetical protein
MSERAEQLATQLDTELSRMVEFLTELTSAQLAAPCKDPQGESVRHVLAHLREGTEQVVTWATSAGGDQHHAHGHDHAHGHGHAHAHGHPHGHGHAHSHEPPGLAAGDQPDEPSAELTQTVAVMREGQAVIVSAVRRLSDEQLDAVPPPSPGLADGATPMHRIVAFIAEDVAGHLAHLREAVDASAAAPRAVA